MSGIIVLSKSSVSTSLAEGVVSKSLVSKLVSGLGLTVTSGSISLGSEISSWKGTVVISSEITVGAAVGVS